MINDQTPLRRYLLPDRLHSGVVDADRLRETVEMLDNDMSAALETAERQASLTSLGRILLATATHIAAGAIDRVPSAGEVKKYVNAEFEKLLGSAPEALDTLSELATALGNDANFAATITNQLAQKLDITSFQAIQNQLIPVGAGMWFFGKQAPAGWLKPYGVLLQRAQATALWAYAQTSGLLVSEADWQAGAKGFFSTGDGSTTFRTPDIRGYHLRVWDDGAGIDADRLAGSIQQDALKSHGHTGSADAVGDHAHSAWTDVQGWHDHWVSGRRNYDTANMGLSYTNLHAGNIFVAVDGQTTTGGGNHAHNVGIGGAGAHGHILSINATGDSETRGKNIAYLFCMKY